MAKSKRVFIEYLLEFVDPSPWPSVYAFERDFADFFMAHGADAEISTILEGGSGRRIITIVKAEFIDPKNQMNPPQKTAIKDQINNLKMPTGKKVK